MRSEPRLSDSARSQALVAELRMHGLACLARCIPAQGEALPALPAGIQAGAVWLVGTQGSAFWPYFSASVQFHDGLPDPLDRWSRALGDALAAGNQGVAIYPFDGPPYYDFQRLAMRSGQVENSPVLVQIHPQYGLWHAYRFALVLPPAYAQAGLVAEPQGLVAKDTAAVPQPDPGICARCDGQPCLRACPVQAFDAGKYHWETCVSHLHSGQGHACLESACLARHACPVGPEYRYLPDHAAFHMRAFVQRHGPGAK